ncbi:MAG: LicD family protein [Ruminococcaceae bacterium]|nr:LicD family protein [Oscillospiraceae bacterium]
MELTNAFFREEERCGYLVSAEMKKVWAIELDLLTRFQELCQQHNLRYFASGGTLIGAVRHGGFIPWDDDIDIMMLREDYDKLLQVAPGAWEAPYFFQTVETDKRYSRGHAQLRHSNTTAMLAHEGKRFPFNQGIFIDIFPVDEVPDDPQALDALRRRLNRYERLLNWGVRYPGNPRKNLLKTAVHGMISLIPYRWLCRRRDKIAARYNGTGQSRVGPITFLPNEDKLLFPLAGFAAVETVPFEQGEIAIPAGYDEILRTQYGDYRKMAKADSYHSHITFDTERCYLDYIR